MSINTACKIAIPEKCPVSYEDISYFPRNFPEFSRNFEIELQLPEKLIISKSELTVVENKQSLNRILIFKKVSVRVWIFCKKLELSGFSRNFPEFPRIRGYIGSREVGHKKVHHFSKKHHHSSLQSKSQWNRLKTERMRSDLVCPDGFPRFPGLPAPDMI